ncbi:hypothetical protein [Dactylosporangium sp. NPDC050588]|uniref:hypothetical protein n=1 Tax=Dactylosporangium sp. NPDC050588 TaxID=3157211 RepID=UPI0034116156
MTEKAVVGGALPARLVVPASWRRSIHPRRGGTRVAYTPVTDAVPDWPDTSAALRLSPAAALADAPSGSPSGAAAAAAILLWTPRVPKFDPRAIADRWIADEGLAFAASAGIELAGLRPLTVRCDAPACPGRHTTVTHRADEADAHNGTLGVEPILAQLRVALTTASDDLHATVIESLSDLRTRTPSGQPAAPAIASVPEPRAGARSGQVAVSGGLDVPAVESLGGEADRTRRASVSKPWAGVPSGQVATSDGLAVSAVESVSELLAGVPSGQVAVSGGLDVSAVESVSELLAGVPSGQVAVSGGLDVSAVESVSELLAGVPSGQVAVSGGLDVPAAEPLREPRAGTLARRIAASFLAPDRTAWVDEDARELAADGRRHPYAPLLMAAAHTPAQAALIRPQIHSVGWRLLRGTAMIHTVAEGLGDGVLDVYAGWHRSDWGTADEQRVLMATLAAVPTDRAFQALLDALDVRGAQPAVETAAERFPERAMRLLSSASRADQLATAPAALSHPATEAVGSAAAAAVSGSSAVSATVSGSPATVVTGSGSPGTAAVVSGSPATVATGWESPGAVAAGWESPGAVAAGSGSPAAAGHLAVEAAQRGARIAELLRRHAVRHPGLVPAVADGARAAGGGLAEAGRIALPAVLVTPPWEVRRAVVKPVVVPGLRCDDEPAVVWPPGEREQLVARLKRGVDRDDPEQLASQLRAGSLEDWLAVDLFEAGPEDLVRPLLATWEPKRLWGAHYWLRLLAARFGVAALPLVLRVARRSPADGGPALLAYAGPKVALLVAGWHGRLKAARAVALEWLRRHPRARRGRWCRPPSAGRAWAAGTRSRRCSPWPPRGTGTRSSTSPVGTGRGPATRSATCSTPTRSTSCPRGYRSRRRGPTRRRCHRSGCGPACTSCRATRTSCRAARTSCRAARTSCRAARTSCRAARTSCRAARTSCRAARTSCRPTPPGTW